MFVRKAIRRLACLNKLIMCLVSLPVYVKVNHLCSFSGRGGGVVGGRGVCERGSGRSC